MLLESALDIGCYTGIQRAIFTLNQVYEVHALRITRLDYTIDSFAILENIMNTLIIFSAKYLYLVVLVIAILYIALQSREKRKWILLLAIIALPLTYVIAKIGSFLYSDPRPFVVGHFVPLIPHSPDNGFPSDHALLTAAISSVLYANSRRIGAILWALTFVVGASRVAAGIHHSIDIVGSMLIAAATTYAVYFFLKKGRDA